MHYVLVWILIFTIANAVDVSSVFIGRLEMIVVHVMFSVLLLCFSRLDNLNGEGERFLEHGWLFFVMVV